MAPSIDMTLALRQNILAENAPMAEDGYVARHTLSGNSLDSFERYDDHWNAIDFGEMTSNHPPGSWQLSGPSLLAQKVHYALSAAEVVKKSLKVVHNMTKVT